MTPRTVELPDQRVWLRVADSVWSNSLDPTFAQVTGNRWNAPGSYATLYLNADVITARLQIERMCAGSPVTPEDLADDAYTVVAATIVSNQRTADVVTDQGVEAAELPAPYPLDAEGNSIPHQRCQPIGQLLFDAGLMACGVDLLAVGMAGDRNSHGLPARRPQPRCGISRYRSDDGDMRKNGLTSVFRIKQIPDDVRRLGNPSAVGRD